MSSLVAITRDISPAFANCELTHLPRTPIDVAKAAAQHAEYERALQGLGCAIQRIGTGEGMPDSVFIEDAAVVLDEVAIVTRPGAQSRRKETPAVADALRVHRPLKHIEAPGTMDGGDVLVVGRSVFVGCSSRTNTAGIEQLRTFVVPFGYRVHPTSVRGCLHLKSAVTALDDDTLLINPAWAREDRFPGFNFVAVDPAEPSGANIVRVGEQLVYSEGHPRTRERIARRGFTVTTVDVGEIAKAEGAVTCCSLIFVTDKDLDCHSAD